MSAVVIDGGLVHYEAFGRGKPVLFLHGWLGSWRYWMSTMEAISDKHRTFALDLWGFGDSDKTRQRFQIQDYVDLVARFVENRGMEDSRITMIGHALGAAVTLQYAREYPERVDKLMAISLPMSSDSINQKLLDPGSAGSGSVVSKMMWWRQPQLVLHKEVQGEIEKTNEQAISTSLQSVQAMNRDLPMENRVRQVGQEGKIFLAVFGEKDDVIDPTPLRDLERNGSQNIRPIGLIESRHFPMLDEASKFQRLLKDFLDVKDDLSVLELKEEWRRRTR